MAWNTMQNAAAISALRSGAFQRPRGIRFGQNALRRSPLGLENVSTPLFFGFNGFDLFGFDGDFDFDDFAFNQLFFGFGSPCSFDGLGVGCLYSPFGIAPFGFSSFPFGNFGLFGFGSPLLFANDYPYWTMPTPPTEYGSYASEPICKPSNGDEANQQAIIVLKGGLQLEVTDYWVAGDQLAYATENGAQGNVPLDQLDLERTVNLNWQNCLAFTLRPGSSPEPPPQP